MIGGFDTAHLQTFYVDEGAGVPRQYTGQMIDVMTDDSCRPHALRLRVVGATTHEFWFNYARVVRWHRAGAG